ncbi:hypothetical protein DNTS_016481 [Danionella cerebrum]|uniref:PDZ domain-containing protein n=1 Tax=Danionella cerebrum TaxID=2873325 RepID=A0A553QGC4_9TELE|nr:hypothetical protein DNTS_016481 [Danionella translucida]TRY88982.1 hypothetical protein DNTS_016481 [Danionella translucida]
MDKIQDAPVVERTMSVALQDAELKDVPKSETDDAFKSKGSSACSQASSSAVSALQSKVKAVNQRKLKGLENDDLLSEYSTQETLKKNTTHEVLSQGQADDTEQSNMSAKSEPKSGFQEEKLIYNKSGIQNPSLEAPGCAAEPQGDIVFKSVTSSPRHWAPPKGFWRVARPETLILNSEDSSSVSPQKDVELTVEEPAQQKPRLKTVGAVVHKELQRSDSLESAFERCFQKNTTQVDSIGGLWKADSWETVCSRGGTLSAAEKVQMNRSYLNKCQGKATEITTLMHPEGQYKQQKVMKNDLPPNIPHNWEPLIPTSEVTLSPRHEQAKRLLERARFKARSQSSQSESLTLGHTEGLEPFTVGVSSTLHNTVLIAAQEDVNSALQSPDLRGRNQEHCLRSQRYGQSPTRVRFEDESEKEAERRYLERVRERGPVVFEESISTKHIKGEPQNNIKEKSGEAAVNWVNITGIPMAIVTKEGDCFAAMVPKDEILRTCEACGSLIGCLQAKDSQSKQAHSAMDPREKAVPRRINLPQSCNQTTHPTIMKTLTGGGNLADVEGQGGVGGAGKSVSAFGKLRRRSRKGESRAETSNGPYARNQDLWTQRRNSKTRSSLEEKTSEALKMPIQATIEVSPDVENKEFTNPVRDYPQPLPIKSALKSSSKSCLSGQKVVKLLPSVQYRLIHIDPNLNGASCHESIPTNEPVTSKLSACSRPSSLKDPKGTYAVPVSSESHPALRSLAISKAEDLRAELLRAEHRKAEIHWDDCVVSRRVVEREGRPKLSLHRFFSAMGLNTVGKLVKGNRSNSMEHLCSSGAHCSSASPTHRGLAPVKRTPSLQSLYTESPLAQLRKASSVQSLQSPKRKFERSTILGELTLPMSLAPRELQNKVSAEEMEDSGSPQRRLVQAFPDGTLLIELIRPANNGPFGFFISRGKGRPDSGIYVERVGGGASGNIYTGLLGVGDEILEVNGESIAGLSLDQVTHLMTQDTKVTLRILPHSWKKH